MKNLLLILLLSFSTLLQAADNPINNGDLLRVSVYGNPDLTTEAKVSASGQINYPLIGTIKLAGLSPPEAEQLVSQRLVQDGFLKRAQVNIIVIQSSGKQVSILGQVGKPGKYSIETGAKTLFDFIAISGGISAKGSDFITIIRMNENPPKRISVNLKKIFLHSKTDQINSVNMQMRAGDIIYVPEAPVFYVYGEARSPGVFRYTSNMTLLQALSMAGGLSARGTDSGLRIQRRNESGQLVEMKANKSSVILADDIVTIQESLF
ncbi:polysaccharide biosynthesis/export family protein [Thiomicrorhabdus arctica]|jgi:polysaccharide export outer membrane protein|uniref:polysaccharide biosynthesis/export family protein n=1 Tax=Thiomicrorhabdus arctica TaxID=131540 RepID=UPI0003698BCC|nr:polysaccharide biosynthesis/export family protein [Thiomicrorhabdus arctica]